MELTHEDRKALDDLLDRRARLVLWLSPVFVAFNAIDWAVHPEHAAAWLWMRLGVYVPLIALHLGMARRGEGNGAVLSFVYATLFSFPISVMTYQSGGFASSYYPGLLAVASGTLVLFPTELRRSLGILGLVLGPYFVLGALHGGGNASRIVNNTAFLGSIGAFLVLGSHLARDLFLKQHRAHRELEELLRSVEETARRDPLTRLFNRRHLDDCMRDAFGQLEAEQRPFSLLIADLDHFKALNDTWGHPAGDLALVKVGEALLRGTRTEDVVARYGGEEFAILLGGATLEAARAVGERLRRNVETLGVVWEGARLPLRISMGLAEARPGETAEALVARADAALYRAKAAGRNCLAAA